LSPRIFAPLFHQPLLVMYLHLLSLLFLFESLFSCGLSQEKTQLNEANLVTKSKATCLQDPLKTVPTASNLVYQSNDLGQTWADVSAGLPEGVSIGRVLANEGEIVMASSSQLFRSGSSAKAPVWRNQLLQNELLQNIEISNLFHGKNGLYVACYRHGFFKELPGANLWIPMDHALKDKTIRSVLEIADGTLFVGVESGLFKSVDGGASWKQVIADTGINSLVSADEAGTVLVCGTYEGLRQSTDGGEHWNIVLTEDLGAWHTTTIQGGIVTITEGGSWKDSGRANRLRLSTDQGKSWQRIDQGLSQGPFMFQVDESSPSPQRIYAIEQAGKYLFCSTNNGIFRSPDMGKSWELVRMSTGKEMFELIVSGGVVYAVQVVGC
jgi:photosystem II stability/assembly factor-like uncharacterized protein